uniref:C-type lectin domain family 4 member F n=2 Tax=Mus musculus TaxID=10090 RepID=CLC4F_MOUSE|nr:RecName: Full=C-type lectin domain family 4 member F; AltName: Full=C-type lectin superfamily member 13; Short=C-type lectin 13; AltName: Full=Kupffer cell receptor [Mus musculus]AAH13647.1 C-type lectin domain family 4, member f [Mus musculus]BAA13647.1 Kupffer cell receptor [Mus musculus]
MKEAELNRDMARYCTDNQCVSLQPQGLGPKSAALMAPRTLRHVQVILALMVVTVIFSLLALFVVASQPWRPEWNKEPPSLLLRGSNNSGHDNHSQFVRETEMQVAIQRLRDYEENSSSCHKEVQILKYQMDNVSSLVQLLGSHLEDVNADILQTKDVLKESGALALETQALRSSLEVASADIHSLRGDLEKANAMTSQTRGLLKSSTENTSAELHVLGRGLEEAQSEIQALRGSLQSANDLSSQTQGFLQHSMDNISAQIQTVRDGMERAGEKMNSLKKELETLTAQTQKANGHLEQTDAQIQGLKAELKSTSSLNSRIEVVNGQMKDASRELQTLRRDLSDVSALKSNVQMLQSNLQRAKTEMQTLKADLQATKALTAKIQGEQNRLGALQEAVAAQKQEQKTQNQVLQLIAQNWKYFNGNFYYFSRDKKPWREAEKFCTSQGAHLASVTSQEEQAFLVQTTSSGDHWIGLTDQGTEGIWRWVDGTPFNNAQSKGFWGKNQPDNWRHRNGEREDCVHVRQQWNDMACGSSYPWVCKKSTGWSAARVG